MKRSRLTLLVGLGLLGLVVVSFFVRRYDFAPEPTALGQPMRYWVKALYETRSFSLVRVMMPGSRGFIGMPSSPATNALAWDKVERAFLEMGAPASPALVEALGCQESFYGHYYRRFEPNLLRIAEYLPSPTRVEIVQHRAYRLLTLMDTNASPAIPQLARLLLRHDPEVQTRAAELLRHFGDRAHQAAPNLIAALFSSNGNVRLAAAAALAHMPSAKAKSIPALYAAWKSQRLPLLRALGALNKLGVAPKEAIPELIALLESGSFPTLTRQPDAAPRAADPPFEKVDLLRTECCEYLGRFGPVSAPAVPALAQMLTHSDSRVRVKAAWALGEIGDAAAAATPALAEAVGDYWWYVRVHAIGALGRIGPGASNGAPALHAALIDVNEEVRSAAANSLDLISGKGQ